MKKEIKNFLTKYLKSGNEKNFKKYTLLEDAFSNEDILSALDVLLSRKITMGAITKEFENEFLNFLDAKHRDTLDALKGGKYTAEETDVLETVAKELSAKY